MESLKNLILLLKMLNQSIERHEKAIEILEDGNTSDIIKAIVKTMKIDRDVTANMIAGYSYEQCAAVEKKLFNL